MTPEADFGIEINFRKGIGNPRRVFDAASTLLDGFEQLDRALVDSIDRNIQSSFVLEDIEAGSVRVWVRNALMRTDDEALKSLDWKQQVGKYLVRAKYIVLEFLDSDEGTTGTRSIKNLREDLRRLAAETDTRHLPDYPAANEGRLISALDRVQSAKRPLIPGDHLIIETDEKRYEVNLAKTWTPSTELTPEDTRETQSEGEVILTIRKPDFIRDTMWSFQHGITNISAPILDEKWLAEFHARHVLILPGDALRARVRYIHTYDSKGSLLDTKVEVFEVIEVIKGAGIQSEMFER